MIPEETNLLSPRSSRLLFATIILLFAVRNLPWHLDDYDQAKQAFVSFEMVEAGQWWFQHTPAGKIATKPPLAGWISATLFQLMGGHGWEFAWRLPPFLSAVALLLLLWKTGCRLAGPAAGLIAAAAFGLNLTAPRLATLVRTDMMLTLFVFGAGWLSLRKVQTATPWTTGERLLLGLAVLGSMLTKGPILYAFLLPGLAVFAGLMRWRKERNHSWGGSLAWFAPLLVFGFWVGIGVRMSPEFYEQVVQREFLGRFDVSDAPVHKHQPVLFYLGHLMGKIWAPWSAALLALCCIPWIRARLGPGRKPAAARSFPTAFRRKIFQADPALLWLVCWAAGGLLLMSLVPSKRPDRIFPIIPPLCLLLGVLAQRWLQVNWPARRRIGLGVLLAALALSGGYTLWNIFQDHRQDQRALVRFGEQVRRFTAGAPERLAVTDASDEGLLIYTGRTRFVAVEDAVKSWRRGEIDWMLIRKKDRKQHEAELAPFSCPLEVGEIKNKRGPYFLLQREPSAVAAGK
ncbi:MAG TPA: glycosyltransferase family 39 protein [Chthoniobacteraceae bacterium]|jgi:4-amino-4-deoxy-L-arabinose transferase-like glycosyltransferase